MTRIRSLALGLMLSAVAATAFAQETRRNYIVQLADPPAAAYTGGIPGIAATRPAMGQRFNASAPAVQAYLAHLRAKADRVTAAVPAARVFARYGVVLNGFAVQLTDDELRKLASTPGVIRITPDELRQLNTNYTPSFLGLNGAGGAWSRFDGQGRAIKGEDVIIGHIDGGVWPENPSFSDKVDALGKPVPYYQPGTVVYGQPPAKWTGTCQAGQGFTTAMCNNKLIGARYFNAGWKANRTAAQLWSFEYLDSPRDADGHGSHTLSTSGGNENVDGLVGGSVTLSGISGMAPRARLAAYKVCYNGNFGPGVSPSGCFNSDSVAAINQAVADGVDVINFSISGSQTSFTDPVETAFRNAAAAGVFVAASAGNSNTNGAPTVAHNSPWIMTVGNSTHDRVLISTVQAGDGSTWTGYSRIAGDGLAAAPLILSTDGALTGANANAANLCFSATWNGGVAVLDPAKVAGKIVVCDRGTNDRVDKSRAVREAGGVGMILLNTSNNSLNNDSHSIPTVHLQFSNRASVRTYAALAGATASFFTAIRDPNAVAPVMNASSSRGPNQADADMLKPDITAPGTDIIAAYANRGLTQAQHDAIAGGNFAAATPWYDVITGTSMSSPHIAGMAALLRQVNPTWSPYAIKSALMTSATQNVKLANGAPDPSPWGYGAGHANPNTALETTVVYDSTNADHLAYYNRTLAGGSSALNVASMTRGNAIGTAVFTRTLTNRGTSSRSLNASASLPGFTVVVTPSVLTLAAGESKSFTVTATATTAPPNTYIFGNVTWTDGQIALRSPLTVRYSAYSGPAQITDTRTAGTKVWTIRTGFAGSMSVTPSGLAAAVRTNAAVSTTGPTQQCAPDFLVPAGTRIVRAQTFNSETQNTSATDIDLYLYRVSGGGQTQVGASESGTTDELISVTNPTEGIYRACVVAFAPAGQLRSTVINTWVVGSASTATPLRAFGATTAYIGGTASVGVAWNVPAGNRYLGLVDIRNPPNTAVLGTTEVFINTTGLTSSLPSAIVDLPDPIKGRR